MNMGIRQRRPRYACTQQTPHTHITHSNFHTQLHARFCNPSSTHNEPTQHNQRPAKHPNVRKTAPIKYPATDGRAEQKSNRHYAETLTHARAYLAAIRHAEMHKDGRGQRDESAGEKAVEQTAHYERCFGADGNEAECHDAAHDAAGDDHVEGACAVGDEVGDDAPEDAGGVYDGEGVEGEAVACDAVLHGVGLDVEKGCVEAHEGDEGAEHKEEVGWLFEGGEVEHLAFGGGEYADFHHAVGDDEGAEHHEA